MDQTVSPPLLKSAAAPSPPPRSRGRLLLRPRILAGLAVLAIAALYAGREVYLRFTHIYEYDARVTADIVTVSSRAEGWIVEMPALEGARVGANDVVVRIDDRIAKLRSDALATQIKSVQAERARLAAERRMIAEQTEAVMRTRRSGVTVKEKAQEIA